MAVEGNWSSGALPSQIRLGASALLTRLPVSMMPLSLLLFVLDQTGSYGWAGLAAGSHVAGYALANPAITRRYAQLGFFRPMLVCSLVYPLLAAVVIALAYSDSVWWPVFPLTGAMGAALPVTHHVLAGAWRRLTEELADHQVAPSPPNPEPASGSVPAAEGSESDRTPLGVRIANTIVGDAGALLGPLLVAALVAGYSADYAIGVAALAALVGSWLLISDPHTATVRVADPRPGASAITRVRSAESRSHLFVALLLSGGIALAGFGVLVAAMTGFARDEAGNPAWTGVFLALWSAGGFVGGIWYGSMEPDSDEWRYRWTLVLVVLAHLPLILVDRTIVLVVLLPLAGAMAAANTAAYTAMVAAVARRVGARSYRSRVATVGYLGFAIGLAVGGVVVGAFSGVWPAFAVCVGVLLVALVSGTLGPMITKRLRERNPRPVAMHSRRG